MDKKPANSPKTDKPWLFQKGQSGNPSGRPKNTMKDFTRQMLAAMTDAEKLKWLKDHEVSGEVIWRMAEGNPTSENINQDNVVITDEEKLDKLAGRIIQAKRGRKESSEEKA